MAVLIFLGRLLGGIAIGLPLPGHCCCAGRR